MGSLISSKAQSMVSIFMQKGSTVTNTAETHGIVSGTGSSRTEQSTGLPRGESQATTLGSLLLGVQVVDSALPLGWL